MREEGSLPSSCWREGYSPCARTPLCVWPFLSENQTRLWLPHSFLVVDPLGKSLSPSFSGPSQVGLGHTHSSSVSCIPKFSCCYGAALSPSLLVIDSQTFLLASCPILDPSPSSHLCPGIFCPLFIGGDGLMTKSGKVAPLTKGQKCDRLKAITLVFAFKV